ncbi:hypothetical protein [Glycomyces sp. NPDC048151]|uniref:CdiA C-terminal domain-containing protein n=1 Tax=Glycomyces sp. NPDC048151 TaxID=3364002 RepID=UPI00371A0DDB
MSSIDEASGAVGSNAEQARELAASIQASKETIESLAGAMAAIGLETRASEANAAQESAEALSGQANGIADALDGLQSQIESWRGLLASPRAAGGKPSAVPATLPATQSKSGTATGSDHPLGHVTKPSLPPDFDRKPDRGHTPIPQRAKLSKQLDIQSENDAAAVLARSGYRIEQNPPPKPNGKEPDYLMEGDYWDCYTPHTGNLDQVRRAIKSKVNPKDGKVQAHRIVVNLDAGPEAERSRFAPADIEGLLQRKPLENLKELKVIKDGHVHDLKLRA